MTGLAGLAADAMVVVSNGGHDFPGRSPAVPVRSLESGRYGGHGDNGRHAEAGRYGGRGDNGRHRGRPLPVGPPVASGDAAVWNDSR
jgi:hypothetical protein